MNRLFLLLLLSLLLCKETSAQNWRTVNQNDTVYFQVTDTGVSYSLGDTTHSYLRAVLIDSVRNYGQDSVCYFRNTFRLPASAQWQTVYCVDTAAASWLGRKNLRKQDGTEYYFNGYGDTITLNTVAGPGDSWALMRDTGNVLFQATVAGVGLQIIDDVTDSIKTIQIQKYVNGVAQASVYNNFPLVLSKNHGWVQTLDMFAFPDIQDQWNWFGAILYSFAIVRIDSRFATMNLNDFSRKYAPGNEWVLKTEMNNNPGPGPTVVLTHDSIQNVVPAQGHLMVTMATSKDSSWYTFVGGMPVFHQADTFFVHTEILDTTSMVPLIIKDEVIPEFVPSVGQWQSGIRPRYYVDTLCGAYIFKTRQAVPRYYTAYSNGCRIFSSLPPVSFVFSDSSVLQGFGNLFFESETWQQATLTNYIRRDVTYLKLQGCGIGNSSGGLAVSAIGSRKMELAVVPNPATDLINIKVPETSVQLTIYDMMGRVVRHQVLQAGNNSLSISDMPAGLYLLRFSGGTINYTYKLIKN